MKKALVIGCGASGKSAAQRLRADGCEVVFADGVDLVVASPGVKVVSELQFGVEALVKRGVKMIAVTGSKGKSSVVKLVADTLARVGRKAVACGNYGLPVSAVGECEWAVVEVSSFQLETTNLPPRTFAAAAILNLQEDHIDRHGSVALYHALKLRLADMAETSFICDAPEDADALLSGSYFDNRVLKTNGRIAAALLRVAGLTEAEIADGFANFSPLPHRMQTVGFAHGIKCIDDSKATSVAALAAGVEMVGSGVRLIAGGTPKGDDPSAATDILKARAKKVYLIGMAAKRFFDAWSVAVPCEICGTMEIAVKKALQDSEKDDIILLSPGAASFDQFNNYEQRGEYFVELIKKEGTEKR